MNFVLTVFAIFASSLVGTCWFGIAGPLWLAAVCAAICLATMLTMLGDVWLAVLDRDDR